MTFRSKGSIEEFKNSMNSRAHTKSSLKMPIKPCRSVPNEELNEAEFFTSLKILLFYIDRSTIIFIIFVCFLKISFCILLSWRKKRRRKYYYYNYYLNHLSLEENFFFEQQGWGRRKKRKEEGVIFLVSWN